MVAFINNDLPVFCDEVFDSLSAVGALDDGNIHACHYGRFSRPQPGRLISLED